MVSRGSEVVTSEVEGQHQELATGPVMEDAQSRHLVAGREDTQVKSSQLQIPRSLRSGAREVSRGDQGTDPRSVSRPERLKDTQFVSGDRSREVHETQARSSRPTTRMHKPHT
jgi:hypothetical protein